MYGQSYYRSMGNMHINLKKIMDQREITISNLSKTTNLKYDIVKRYYLGDLRKIDLEILGVFCDYLDCQVSDIIEYEIVKKQVNSR